MFFTSSWWIIGLGKSWQQWAKLSPDGRVGIYDPHGKVIWKAKYKNRYKARAALKKRGFRKLSRKERKLISPPHVERRLRPRRPNPLLNS